MARMGWIAFTLIVSTAAASIAAASDKAPTPERRNNFVVQLVSARTLHKDNTSTVFTNPREGWVYIAIEKPHAGQRSPVAFLDGETVPLVWRSHPETGALEAMRLLSMGSHALRIEHGHGVRLNVRAIPEIIYCYYPTSPHIACYGPYDWAYTQRHVLSDVNTLVTRVAAKPEEFDQWLREGRRWISNASLPGLGKATPPTVDEVYALWAGNPGMAAPGYDGMIVDEFCGSDQMHYGPWTEAVRRLHENPAFADRVFYAWCGDLYAKETSLTFAHALQDWGYRFVWEKYLHEAPTAQKAFASIDHGIAKPLQKWQAQMSHIERQLVVCLGYLSAPPESLNRDPAVDYHVFMDMQFHRLATDPAFAELYGIMEYVADYADEESLRYAQALFRHYCIEGKRSRYNGDPYCLNHVTNPDFADGFSGWAVKPAENGSIASDAMKGFGWLQGRYPITQQGDRFCVMKRSAAGPNGVEQTIRHLKPGRLYSVKLLSADPKHLERADKTALSIAVTGAEVLPEYAIQFVFPSCYSHKVSPYDENNPAHMDYHRVVFKAKSHTARLAIADWVSPTAPGGPVGQETAINFVEVQPFHAQGEL